MRRSRSVIAAVIILVASIFIGGFQEISHASPLARTGKSAQTFGLTRATSSAGGFTLDPNEGKIGTSVVITPPQAGGSSGSNPKFAQVDAMGYFGLALGKSGKIVSWGDNYHGELGIGVQGGKRDRPVEVKTPAGKRFTQISAGVNHALAIDSDGLIWSWGLNDKKQLGIGDDTSTRSTPVQVKTPAGKRFTKISAGRAHSMAIDTDGQLWGWGSNSDGQVGNGRPGVDQPVPTEVYLHKQWTNSKVRAKEVSAGGYHTAAIGEGDDSYTWGRGTEWQLGRATNESLSTPLDVRSPANIVQVSAGDKHTLVLTEGGYYPDGYYPRYVWGFGSNEFGQVGNYLGQAEKHNIFPYSKGIEDYNRIPFTLKRDVDANSFPYAPLPYGEPKFVNAGVNHSLAIAKNADSREFYGWGWGRNDKNQIGSRAHTDRPRIVQATPYLMGPEFRAQPTFLESMSAGIDFSVGLSADGTAYTWGDNEKGQLADGSPSNLNRDEFKPITSVQSDPTPLEITGVEFDGVNAPRVGGVAANGAWNVRAPQPNRSIGSNGLPVKVKVSYKDENGNARSVDLDYKYLGDPDPGPTSPPSPPSPPTPPGESNIHFDLGGAPGTTPPDQWVTNGNRVKWPNPTPEWEDHWFVGWYADNCKPWDFSDPVTGSMTLTAHWETYEFDLTPHKGPTTGGTDATVTAPEPPKSLKYTQVSAGDQHTLAVGADGNVYAWGSNARGQLGDGSRTNSSVPVRVKAPNDVRFILVAAGDQHSMALDTQGRVWCWGENAHGQLGDQSTSARNTPVQVNQMVRRVEFKEISAGGQHSLALDTNGDAWAWGFNQHGELGNNDFRAVDQWHPEPVSTNQKVQVISAGRNHSLAVTRDGDVLAWGENNRGQLGDQSTSNRRQPVSIDRVVNGKLKDVKFKSVSAGGNHSLGLDTNGDVWAWGNNNNGKLGNAEQNVDQWHPVAVVQYNNRNKKFKSISAGGTQSLAIATDGTPWSWGANNRGQLGDNRSVDQWHPEPVYSNAKYRVMSAGNAHNVGIDTDAVTRAWGENNQSQLGTGNTVMQRLHTEVVRQKLVVTRVTFDRTDTNPAPVSTRPRKWDMKSPAHPEGVVDVTVHWTLGGFDQKDYVFSKYKDINRDLRAGFAYYETTPPTPPTPPKPPKPEPPIDPDPNCPPSAPKGQSTVHFDLNGAPGVRPANQRVTNGERLKWPDPTPQWPGHLFEGWFTDDGQPWNFTDPVTGNMILTARWEAYGFKEPHPKEGLETGGTETAIGISKFPQNLVYTQVSAGEGYTLALGADGFIYGWGWNAHGQLGNGSKVDASVPVRVKTPAGKHFMQVSAGDYHALALDTEGNVYAWGANDSGQLGLGTENASLVPVPIAANGRKFTDVSAGSQHSLALDTNGKVWGWGYNYHGQVGNETTDNQLLPVRTNTTISPTLSNLTVKAISASGDHSMALATNGTVWSWGENNRGQLGNNDSKDTDQWHPVKIKSSICFNAVSAGVRYSLALDVDGQAWSWGENNRGQLGDGSTTNRRTPVKVNTDARFKSISAGEEHSLATGKGGYRWSWGANNDGQLGDNTLVDRRTPNRISTIFVMKAMSAGRKHSVSVDDCGRVETWGSNEASRLGRGDSLPANTPRALAPAEIDKQRLVVTGVEFDGTPSPTAPVFDPNAEIDPNGLRGPAWKVTTPPHPMGEVDVAVSWTLGGYEQEKHVFDKGFKYTLFFRKSCVVSFKADQPGATVTGAPSDQSVDCGQRVKWPSQNPKRAGYWFEGWFTQDNKPWDFNDPVTRSVTLTARWEAYHFKRPYPSMGSEFGGTQTAIGSPQAPQNLVYTQVSAGEGYTLALGADGFIYGWGWNAYGQLGDGSKAEASVPVRVKSPAGVRFLQVSAGDYHALALDSEGNVYSWGANDKGQLGDDSKETRLTPVRARVSGVKFQAVAAGGKHSLALDTQGRLWSWGYCNHGQLGDSDTISTQIPIKIRGYGRPNLDNLPVKAISAAGDHSLALAVDGTVWSWGENNRGQLGNNDPRDIDQWHPVRINIPASVESISAGTRYSLALDSNGKVWSWGENNQGQLGDGSRTNRRYPAQIYINGRMKSISAGLEHSSAVADDGSRWVWGANATGQLGDKTTTSRTLPVRVSSDVPLKAVSAGRKHSVSVDERGRVQTWGSNEASRLGRGDSSPSRLAWSASPLDLDKSRVAVSSVTFDANGRRYASAVNKPVFIPNTVLDPNGDRGPAWQVTVPAHSPGKVDVTIAWTVAGYDQESYVMREGFVYLLF